mgnify:CR=1 FL=1
MSLLLTGARRAQAGGELGGIRVAVTRVGRGEDDAGGLGLELDGAVEVEVPVEAVVVVADGGEEGNHQAAVPAGVVDAGPEVAVLGQDAPVLLMHADAAEKDRPAIQQNLRAARFNTAKADLVAHLIRLRLDATHPPKSGAVASLTGIEAPHVQRRRPDHPAARARPQDR